MAVDLGDLRALYGATASLKSQENAAAADIPVDGDCDGFPRCLFPAVLVWLVMLLEAVLWPDPTDCPRKLCVPLFHLTFYDLSPVWPKDRMSRTLGQLRRLWDCFSRLKYNITEKITPWQLSLHCLSDSFWMEFAPCRSLNNLQEECFQGSTCRIRNVARTNLESCP